MKFLGLTLKREAEQPASPPTVADLMQDFLNSIEGVGFSPQMIERVWAAERCIQLNSQQIAMMPLRFFGSSGSEPAWVSSPDPVWYPNGIQDALFAAVRSLYGWGDAFIYVTARYANGFPSSWTVLDPSQVGVYFVNGRRSYRLAETPIDSSDVVQVSRNPGRGVRGTSALQAYAAAMTSSLSSSDLGRRIIEGGIPNAVLKSQRKLTEAQAVDLQNQWVERTSLRRGAPAVLPPDVDFETLSFDPKALMLLDGQQFDARTIASAFGVPAVMLNLPLEASLTYQNPAMLFEQWWRSELRQTATRFTQAMSANMLPRGQWVEVDARDALAPDFAATVQAWEKIITFGGASTDEFRAAVLRLPPQPPADSVDDLLVPSVASSTQATNVQPFKPLQEVKA